MSSRARWLGVVLATAALGPACSNAAPLGGPFGGDGFSMPPTNGTYIDAGTYTPPEPPSPPSSGDPGTWNHIYGAYFQRGTPGNCPQCHGETSNAAKTYDWLKDLEYVGSTPPLLTDFGQSCLAWFGGSMPPGLVPKDDALVEELNQWSQHGGKKD